MKVPRLSRYVEGDEIYIKSRVEKIIYQIQTRSSWEVFTEFRKQIGEINKQIEAEEAANTERMRLWNIHPDTQTPATPTPLQRTLRRPRRGRPPIRGNRRQRGELLRWIEGPNQIPDEQQMAPIAPRINELPERPAANVRRLQAQINGELPGWMAPEFLMPTTPNH